MSSYVETYQERQDNEFQALQAIFADDLIDLRESGNCEEWEPLEVKITLFPQQGSSNSGDYRSQIDLKVKCGDTYPDKEPEIALEKCKGLPDKLINQLQSELESLMQSHKGEVMIFDLTQHVQTFLFKHSTKKAYGSFWDEMHCRQQQQNLERMQAQQHLENLECQEIKNEILRRREMLRAESKQKVEYKLSITDNEITLANPSVERTRTLSRRRCQSTSESSEGSQCEHRGTKVLQFTNKGERHIRRGRCIGHSDRGSTLFTGLDITTGELVAITEWQIKLQTSSDAKSNTNQEYPDLTQCMKSIASIEQELSFLTKLKHENLVNYLNMKYLHENDSVVVYILQEFVIGTNCSALFMRENFMIEIDMLRFFAEGILNALDFLHKNNIIHRDIRDSCIFIDQSGTVKLADYSLDRRMYDLVTRSQNQNRNYSKKNDVFKFGILLLTLLKGGCLIDENTPRIPVSLPDDLRDFLQKCLAADERNRWTAAQLLKHGFVRSKPTRFSPARVLDPGPVTDKDQINDSKLSQHEEIEDDEFNDKTFIPIQSGGQSRIHNEFEILKWLGKGAYGDVLKVRNKLDGRIYAIKRIQLDPKNKQLNKKITREVKLLSRLNHENVVRYYNSWIESASLEKKFSSNDLSKLKITSKSSPEVNKTQKEKNTDLKGLNDDIELLAPPLYDVEWSISYESKSKAGVPQSTSSDEESSDGDDDDDDDDEWDCFVANSSVNSDSSESIEFEKDSGNIGSEFQSPIESPEQSSTPVESKTDKKEIQFMYIQMEFCEKSTLRIAIDNGLHKDIDRVWRLFREIVEGLSHIHQQGMIHRDLKPVNIFLDSNDHVKIGDFGLATTNIFRPNTMGVDMIRKSIHDLRESDVMSAPAVGDGSLTGQVGTALYVAPELNTTSSKAIYNQKVDIYSMGIILFEMAYIPLTTSMERVQILANLRHSDIKFPDEFLDSRLITVIKRLLNHDASQRPTCQELLQSELIPPPVIEEYELQELVRHTLANTQSKAYRCLIDSCFKQDITPAEDITYDMNLPRGNLASDRPRLLQEYVKVAVTRIFKLHGGQCLTTPLLMPKSKYYDGTESCVRMMTRSGEIVSVPHDLRVPFARYVAWNGISFLKRFSIERVYREKKVFGFHPRELYECAFDIITSTPGGLMAEAELLSIMYEITQELLSLRSKNFTIRLNHTSLLRAILLHCGIEEEKHGDVYSILSDARDGKFSKFQIQTHLISLCLSDQAMLTLFDLIETESPISKLVHTLRVITRRKSEASILAKQGLKDLETIIQNTEALGVKCNIVVAPGLVYNVHQCSGMMCQFVCELKKKRRKGGMDVIAAGGRYDTMLKDFRSTLVRTGMLTKDVSQSGVGISISLDKLVQAIQEEGQDATNESSLDVVLCSVGVKPMLNEKSTVLRELWSNGIRCGLFDETGLEEIQEHSRELNVPHIIILRDTDQTVTRVRSWERDRFQERKIPTAELADYMHRLLKMTGDGSGDIVNVVRSDSKTTSMNYDMSPSVNLPALNIRFVTTEKMAANTRRRLENQITSQLSAVLQRISSKVKVEVLGLHVENSVIRTLASYIDMEAEDAEFEKNVLTIIEKHSRHKKYLREIFDEIIDMKCEKSSPVLILYSLNDSYFKIVL